MDVGTYEPLGELQDQEIDRFREQWRKRKSDFTPPDSLTGVVARVEPAAKPQDASEVLSVRRLHASKRHKTDVRTSDNTLEERSNNPGAGLEVEIDDDYSIVESESDAAQDDDFATAQGASAEDITTSKASIDQVKSFEPHQRGLAATRDAPTYTANNDQSGLQKTLQSPVDTRTILEQSQAGMVLPANKVFPIQVGSQLYQLSGASISSDAPSYFSQFFQRQMEAGRGGDTIRTLYLDRDPDTFKDISLHLQGYHIEPRDTTHYVRLFADVQFYGLSRLNEILHRTHIFARICEEDFKISKNLFSAPGNSPNYFSVCSSMFMGSDGQPFPGLDHDKLLRPPALIFPSVPDRCPKLFREILTLLKGYEPAIRDEIHRQALLRDVRYYNLKGLEQRLIRHQLVRDHLTRELSIIISLEDVHSDGFGHTGRVHHSSDDEDDQRLGVAIVYGRPYVQDVKRPLILQLAENAQCMIDFNDAIRPRLALRGAALRHVQRLLAAIIQKFVPQANHKDISELSSSSYTIDMSQKTHVIIDGHTIEKPGTAGYNMGYFADLITEARKRYYGTKQSLDISLDRRCCPVLRSQWRLFLDVGDPTAEHVGIGLRLIWQAVKLEVASHEASEVAGRGFL